MFLSCPLFSISLGSHDTRDSMLKWTAFLVEVGWRCYVLLEPVLERLRCSNHLAFFSVGLYTCQMQFNESTLPNNAPVEVILARFDISFLGA